MAYDRFAAVDEDGLFPPEVLDALAASTQLANARNGVTPMTTTERDALSGIALWEGRVILNTTDDRIQRYEGGVWKSISDLSDLADYALADHTHGTMGAAVNHLAILTNWSQGSSYSNYHVIGDLVFWNYTTKINGSPSGDMIVELPIPAADESSIGWVLLGRALAVDVGVGVYYEGSCWLYPDQNHMRIVSGTDNNFWDASTPFGWSNLDGISWQVAYRGDFS